MKNKLEKSMNETGIEDLANAIILQAVKDYRSALAGRSVNGRDSKSVIVECERFFRSEWFRELTDVDGMIIIANIRKEFEKEKLESRMLLRQNGEKSWK